MTTARALPLLEVPRGRSSPSCDQRYRGVLTPRTSEKA